MPLFGSLYGRWMSRWEQRLCFAATNRVVRPFDWGLEWANHWPVSQSHPRNGHDPLSWLLELSQAALLTALFIFPASLLRPFGGWLSDRLGARRVMYYTFVVMLLASGVLMMPYGYIVLNNPDGTSSQVMPWSVGVALFTFLVFTMGCAMGIGKAAVYKHIPEYFPNDVGAVGGLVGTLGALGGFFLPLLFAYTNDWTSLPQSTFFVIFVVTAIAAIWMHTTVISIMHMATPELANKFEHDHHAPLVEEAPFVDTDDLEKTGAER